MTGLSRQGQNTTTDAARTNAVTVQDGLHDDASRTAERLEYDNDIFINCNWVVTRWQYTFTHKQYTEQNK